jgi:hypothetical protein
VVIDWGFGSLLPVGFDLGQLLVGLMHAGQAEPSELPEIDAVIFPAYLDGLRAESYEADPGQVRAGYVGSLAARSALCALPAELLTSAAPDEATEIVPSSASRLVSLSWRCQAREKDGATSQGPGLLDRSGLPGGSRSAWGFRSGPG